LATILWKIKKSLLELFMMDRVRMLIGGIVGVEYSGAEGGGGLRLYCLQYNDAVPLPTTNEEV
jgi:hypothetical protein